MSAPVSPPADATLALDVPRPKKRRLALMVTLAVAVAAIAIASFHYGRLALSTEETDNAYISGHVHVISAGVSGPLVEVLAKENDTVEKGQVLARIDSREFDIMEKKAAAAMEQAKARKLSAEAGVAEARSKDKQAEAMILNAEAEVKVVESRLALAEIVQKRDERILAETPRGITQAEVDQARSGVKVAGAEMNAAKAKLEAARASKESGVSAIEAAKAEIASAEAEMDVQKAAIDEARRQKSLAEVVAPAKGRIGNKNAETGNRVQTGQSLYALVEENYWIVANFKETQLNKMRTGQEVDVSVDALGGKHFKGRVESLSPATGAQFALLPPDNATGNFTKVVQRVPVKISFDPESIKGFEERLRPGLSTEVRVTVQ
jgi:membrane fusion protein (multidrug efflux system)